MLTGIDVEVDVEHKGRRRGCRRGGHRHGPWAGWAGWRMGGGPGGWRAREWGPHGGQGPAGHPQPQPAHAPAEGEQAKDTDMDTEKDTPGPSAPAAQDMPMSPEDMATAEPQSGDNTEGEWTVITPTREQTSQNTEATPREEDEQRPKITFNFSQTQPPGENHFILQPNPLFTFNAASVNHVP